jgi:hypothetical protein
MDTNTDKDPGPVHGEENSLDKWTEIILGNTDKVQYLVECGDPDSSWTSQPFDTRQEAEDDLQDRYANTICSSKHYVTEYRPEYHGTWDPIRKTFIRHD